MLIIFVSQLKMELMNIKYPHKIENCIGETLIFKEVLKEQEGDRLLVENYAAPGKGPVMNPIH